jgi:hypothetical protein
MEALCFSETMLPTYKSKRRNYPTRTCSRQCEPQTSYHEPSPKGGELNLRVIREHKAQLKQHLENQKCTNDALKNKLVSAGKRIFSTVLKAFKELLIQGVILDGKKRQCSADRELLESREI